MDAQRLDRLSSAFASRFSRRNAVKAGGLGLGVGALGAAGLHHAAAAQDATPAGSPAAVQPNLGLPEGERTYFMFVQAAQAGTWAPKAGEEGVYTLTLTGLPAQTVYFSDRPARIVGTQPTADFLQALGFAEENPPNAALVTKADDGQDDILVIELFNPVYTEGDGAEGATLVYEARILENYHETNLGRVALEQDDTAIPAAFEGASLFIDDCSDAYVYCTRRDTNKSLATMAYGCCWAWKYLQCVPCWDYSGICASVPGCENDGCVLEPRGGSRCGGGY